MGFILDVDVTVEAGEGRPMHRLLERLQVDLERTPLAALPVATNAIFGSVGPDGVDQKAAEGQGEANEEANLLQGVI